METKVRLTHFDLLKLIALLFVCFSHVYQRTVPNATQTIIFGIFYSVHMSIFMFVGGYFVKRCDSLKELAKYIGKMILYYVYPAVIFTILTVISMERYSGRDVLYWLNEFYVRTDTFYWYAISAIIINGFLAISVYIARKIIRKNGLPGELMTNAIVLILFGLLFLPIIFIFKSETPGMLASNLTVEFVPLAVAGFLIKSFGKYIKINAKSRTIEIAVAIVCLVGYIVALINFQGWLKKNTNLLLFLHQLGALAGVYCYYVLSKWLCRIKPIANISAYGKYSYPIYLVHVYLIRVITPYVSRITEVNFYSVSFVIIYALVFTFGSMVISIALTKNKYINFVLFGDYKPLLPKKTMKG